MVTTITRFENLLRKQSLSDCLYKYGQLLLFPQVFSSYHYIYYLSHWLSASYRLIFIVNRLQDITGDIGNSIHQPMKHGCSVFECTICASCRTAKDDGKRDTAINNSLVAIYRHDGRKTPKSWREFLNSTTPAFEKHRFLFALSLCKTCYSPITTII